MQIGHAADVLAIAAYATVAQIGGGSGMPEGPIGLLIGGLGFASYWIVKAFLEVKSSRQPAAYANGNGNGNSIIWAKLQEVLDAMRHNQEQIKLELERREEIAKQLLDKIHEHDSYVKEHVGSRGIQIAQQLSETMAPLIVNAIHTAFDAEDRRKAAAADTQPVKRKRRKQHV